MSKYENQLRSDKFHYVFTKTKKRKTHMIKRGGAMFVHDCICNDYKSVMTKTV